MWIVVVAFLGLMAGLVDWAARRGQPVPVAARAALLTFLTVIGLAAWATSADLTTRATRAPQASLAALEEVDDQPGYRAFLRATIMGETPGEWVYASRTTLTPSELVVDVAGAPLKLRYPRIFGEPMAHRQHGLRAGGEVLVEGEPQSYTDGEVYLDSPSVYAWSLEDYRSELRLEAWVAWLGAAAAALVAAVFLGRWATTPPREDEAEPREAP